MLFECIFPLTCSNMISGGVGAGWFCLIARAILPIEEENRRRQQDSLEPKLLTLGQIKSKWGGLRIYPDSCDDLHDWVHELINQAEREADHTCAGCGADIKPLYNARCNDCKYQQYQ